MMRRGRVFFYLAFVLILGLVAVLVVYQRFIRPSQTAAEQATPTPVPVRVVILAQNLPKGYILDETVMTSVPWQQDAIAPGMFLDSSMIELVGRQIKYDLQAGTPVLDVMLLREGEQIPMGGSSWALNIPPGMVAVSIPISRLSSVSYAPRSGDHVNVMVSMLFVDVDTNFQSILPNLAAVVTASGPPDPETGQRDPLTVDISAGIIGRTEIDPVLGQAIYLLPSEVQRPRMVSQMLLQNVIVLQIGDFPLAEEIQASPTPEGEAAAQPTEEQPQTVVKPDLITLMVTPQDAVALNYLIYSGAELTLALRGANDDSRENITPVTLQFLLEQYQIPVPVRLPYGQQPRIDDLVQPALPNDVPVAPPQ